MNEIERIQLAQAVKIHRLHNYIVIAMPDDCLPDDIDRFAAEAQMQFPMNGLICRTYCTTSLEDRPSLPKGATWHVAK